MTVGKGSRPGKPRRPGRGPARPRLSRGATTTLGAIGLVSIPLLAGVVGGDGLARADGLAPVMSAHLAQVVPNSYVVVLKGDGAGQGAATKPTATVTAPTGVSAPKFAATVRAQQDGVQVTHEFHAALNGFSATLDAPALEAMRRDPDVAFVVPNKIYNLFDYQNPLQQLIELGRSGGNPLDALAHFGAAVEDNPPWGLDRIDHRGPVPNGTYYYGATGRGVNAYVIDTGVRSTHTQLAGRVAPGFTVVDDGRGTEDCNNHGTHVAGTVGGATFGVAKQVNVVPVRVFDCTGMTTTDQVITAVDWVTANHQSPAVANMSLGGPTDEALDAAVARSIRSGVTYVVAAGNSNVDACTFTPARVPTAITVAATAKGDFRAEYSNYGNCVDIFAPGSGITSSIARSDTATANFDGTSMASPHVAGSVALYLQTHPWASPAQVQRAMVFAAQRNVVNDPQGAPNRLLHVQGSIFG